MNTDVVTNIRLALAIRLVQCCRHRGKKEAMRDVVGRWWNIYEASQQRPTAGATYCRLITPATLYYVPVNTALWDGIGCHGNDNGHDVCVVNNHDSRCVYDGIHYARLWMRW